MQLTGYRVARECVVEARRFLFEVFGRRILVEATDGGWTAFDTGGDGKRRPAHIVIPPHLDGPGIAAYLDDLFHEHATPEHPAVRML